MTDFQEKIVLVVVSAFLAAILIPWLRDAIKNWWRRPNVVLEVGQGDGFFSDTAHPPELDDVAVAGLLDPTAITPQDDSRYCRIKVTNRGRWLRNPVTATGCVCYLAKLEVWDEDRDVFVNARYHDFLRLVWSYNADVKGADLLQDTPHYLDVFFTVKNQDRFFLATAVLAKAYRKGFWNGWYRFTIQLSAENTGPKQVQLYLRWDGKYYNDFRVMGEAEWVKVKAQMKREQEERFRKQREAEELRKAEQADETKPTT